MAWLDIYPFSSADAALTFLVNHEVTLASNTRDRNNCRSPVGRKITFERSTDKSVNIENIKSCSVCPSLFTKKRLKIVVKSSGRNPLTSVCWAYFIPPKSSCNQAPSLKRFWIRLWPFQSVSLLIEALTNMIVLLLILFIVVLLFDNLKFVLTVLGKSIL